MNTPTPTRLRGSETSSGPQGRESRESAKLDKPVPIRFTDRQREMMRLVHEKTNLNMQEQCRIAVAYMLLNAKDVLADKAAKDMANSFRKRGT